MSYVFPLRAGIIRDNENRHKYSTIPYDYTRGISFITYPGIKRNQYTITTEGKVVNIKTGLEIKQCINNKGYCYISLPTEYGKMCHASIHRLVAYQFCNPPIDIENYHVNHIDGNKQNNVCGNLEWLSVSANIQHSMQYLHSENLSYTGRIRPDATPELIENICYLFSIGKTDTEVMNELNMVQCDPNYSFLSDIRNRRSWTGISSKYKFSTNSQAKVYTPHDIEKIKEYYNSGCMDPYDIYYNIEGIKYSASKEAMRKINAIKRVYGTMRRAYLREKGC